MDDCMKLIDENLSVFYYVVSFFLWKNVGERLCVCVWHRVSPHLAHVFILQVIFGLLCVDHHFSEQRQSTGSCDI